MRRRWSNRAPSARGGTTPGVVSELVAKRGVVVWAIIIIQGMTTEDQAAQDVVHIGLAGWKAGFTIVVLQHSKYALPRNQRSFRMNVAG